jgi:hypothetical protein
MLRTASATFGAHLRTASALRARTPAVLDFSPVHRVDAAFLKSAVSCYRGCAIRTSCHVFLPVTTRRNFTTAPSSADPDGDHKANAKPSKTKKGKDKWPRPDHAYGWIDSEAEDLIARAYARHRALANTGLSFPPSLSAVDLEKIGVPTHYPPASFVDKASYGLMRFLRRFVHAFFRERQVFCNSVMQSVSSHLLKRKHFLTAILIFLILSCHIPMVQQVRSSRCDTGNYCWRARASGRFSSLAALAS